MIGFPGSRRKISIADAIRQIPGTFAIGGGGQDNRKQHEQEEIWCRKIQKVWYQAYRLRRHGGTPKGNFAKANASQITFCPSGGSSSIRLIADYGSPCPVSRRRRIVEGDDSHDNRQPGRRRTACARGGSGRVDRHCFCQVYAVPRLRLAVKYGIE